MRKCLTFISTNENLFLNLILDNVYQPSRCEGVIEELRQCCVVHKEISLVCEGIDTSKKYDHKTVDYVSITILYSTFQS